MNPENINECKGEHEFKSFKKKTVKPQESIGGPAMKAPEKTTYQIRCVKCGLPIDEIMKKDNHEKDNL